MKAIARAHLHKLLQYGELLPDGALRIRSSVFLEVSVDGEPGLPAMVDGIHMIQADGAVQPPKIGRPPHFAGPWCDVECTARISDYIGWANDLRPSWFHGTDNVFMANRLRFSERIFEFEFEDGKPAE